MENPRESGFGTTNDATRSCLVEVHYYEFLGICLFKELISEAETKLFFIEPLKSVKEIFDDSVLFKEGYAEKSQYKALLWLFKRWNIDY